jgi:hypothetical protein
MPLPQQKVNFQGISVLKNGAAGRQPRRAAFWKAQHIVRYVGIYKGLCNAGSRPAAPFFYGLRRLGGVPVVSAATRFCAASIAMA